LWVVAQFCRNLTRESWEYPGRRGPFQRTFTGQYALEYVAHKTLCELVEDDVPWVAKSRSGTSLPLSLSLALSLKRTCGSEQEKAAIDEERLTRIMGARYTLVRPLLTLHIKR